MTTEQPLTVAGPLTARERKTLLQRQRRAAAAAVATTTTKRPPLTTEEEKQRHRRYCKESYARKKEKAIAMNGLTVSTPQPAAAAFSPGPPRLEARYWIPAVNPVQRCCNPCCPHEQAHREQVQLEQAHRKQVHRE
jgi:hypothetical protein